MQNNEEKPRKDSCFISFRFLSVISVGIALLNNSAAYLRLQNLQLGNTMDIYHCFTQGVHIWRKALKRTQKDLAHLLSKRLEQRILSPTISKMMGEERAVAVETAERLQQQMVWIMQQQGYVWNEQQGHFVPEHPDRARPLDTPPQPMRDWAGRYILFSLSSSGQQINWSRLEILPSGDLIRGIITNNQARGKAYIHQQSYLVLETAEPDTFYFSRSVFHLGSYAQSPTKLFQRAQGIHQTFSLDRKPMATRTVLFPFQQKDRLFLEEHTAWLHSPEFERLNATFDGVGLYLMGMAESMLVAPHGVNEPLVRDVDYAAIYWDALLQCLTAEQTNWADAAQRLRLAILHGFDDWQQLESLEKTTLKPLLQWLRKRHPGLQSLRSYVLS